MTKTPSKPTDEEIYSFQYNGAEGSIAIQPPSLDVPYAIVIRVGICKVTFYGGVPIMCSQVETDENNNTTIKACFINSHPDNDCEISFPVAFKTFDEIKDIFKKMDVFLKIVDE